MAQRRRTPYSHPCPYPILRYATLGGGQGGFQIALAAYDAERPGRTPGILACAGGQDAGLLEHSRRHSGAEDGSMRRVFRDGHRLPRQRFARQQGSDASIAEVISEFERPFLDGDADRASSGFEREFSSSDVAQFVQGEGTTVPETQDGPAWSAHRPPEYEVPPNQTPRAFRILKGGSVAYDDRDARYVVEVWRGQRRHPASLPERVLRHGVDAAADSVRAVTEDFWRYEESTKMALRLGTGTVATSQDAANDPYFQYDPENMNMNFAKEVCRPYRIVVAAPPLHHWAACLRRSSFSSLTCTRFVARGTTDRSATLPPHPRTSRSRF